MNHKETCPIEIAIQGSWDSTSRPYCNCGGNEVANLSHDHSNPQKEDNNIGTLTPLGEALQKPCPRCERPWIQHDCPTHDTLNSPNVAVSGCEHEFKFSHQSVEARGVQAIYQTVIYVICPKCGLVKLQI